jgi:hypothetical protein
MRAKPKQARGLDMYSGPPETLRGRSFLSFLFLPRRKENRDDTSKLREKEVIKHCVREKILPVTPTETHMKRI